MDETSISAHLEPMKATFLHMVGAVAVTFTIAACIPSVERPAPAPAPEPVSVARPAPMPTQAPSAPSARFDDWLDAPQTPGDWRYSARAIGGIASYTTPSGGALVVLECDQQNREIRLVRQGEGQNRRALDIRTETISRTLNAQPMGAGFGARLDIRDPLLDAMALSKGRFAVEVEGLAPIYLPAWAEVTRVIEDCR